MGWQSAKLGDVCSFEGGTQPPKSQFVSSPQDGYIRLLQIRDFKSDDKTVYVRDTPKNKTCNEDDIMIARYGASVGQIHRGKKGAYNVALIKTCPDLCRINRDFFYYYLTSPLFQKPLLATSARGAQDGFNRSDISPFSLLLPPLREQRRIVAILDEAFDGIATAKANAEKNLANAKELFESYLNFVFTEKGEGWVEATLQQVATIIMGQSPPSASYNADYRGVPLINGPDEFGGLDPFSETLDTKFTTEPTKMAEKGDLILCVRGSTTGRMNIAGHNACIGRGVAAIQPNIQDDKKWIYRFISFNRDAIHKLGIGSTFPNVSSSKLKDLLIPFPPQDVRKEFTKGIERLGLQTQQLRTAYQQKLTDFTELKQSILQKAFAGELH